MVGSLASNARGDNNLTETVVSPTSVGDIWSGLTSVDTDCSAREESCDGRKGLLVRDQRLLEILGWGPCWFGIFGSGLTLLEDVDAKIRVLGEDMPCGYVGIR